MATVLSLPWMGNHQRPSQHFNHRFAIDERNMMYTTDGPIPTLLAKNLFRHAQFPSGKSRTDRSCVKNLGQVKQFCLFIETKPSLDSLRHKAPNPSPVHSPTCASPRTRLRNSRFSRIGSPNEGGPSFPHTQVAMAQTLLGSLRGMRQTSDEERSKVP